MSARMVTLSNGARVRLSRRVMRNLKKDRDSAARAARLFLGVEAKQPYRLVGGKWRNNEGHFVRAPSSR